MCVVKKWRKYGIIWDEEPKERKNSIMIIRWHTWVTRKQQDYSYTYTWEDKSLTPAHFFSKSIKFRNAVIFPHHIYDSRIVICDADNGGNGGQQEPEGEASTPLSFWLTLNWQWKSPKTLHSKEEILTLDYPSVSLKESGQRFGKSRDCSSLLPCTAQSHIHTRTNIQWWMKK